MSTGLHTRTIDTPAAGGAGQSAAAGGQAVPGGRNERVSPSNPTERQRLALRIHAPGVTVVVSEVVASVMVGMLAWQGVGWPWLLAAAVLVLAVGFVSFKDASLTRWALIWWRWWRGATTKPVNKIWAAAAQARVVDVALPGDEGEVGIRWDGDILVTAIELCPQPHTPTVLADGIAVTVDTVPLPVVAQCLWQFDINLVGIDVASVGRRVVAGTAYARSYDQLVGVKPGVVSRRSWLILRMRFDADDPGIRNRGGGIEGAVAAAIAATRRTVRRLRESGCAAVAADSESLAGAHTALTAGLVAQETQVERGALATASRFVTTFRLHPSDLTNVNLGAWWSYRCTSAAMIIRLTAGSQRGEVGVRAWVRYATAARPERSDRLPGLIRQYGDQADALAATLPLGENSWKAQRRMVSSPLSVVSAQSLTDLQIPVGPSGQLIGTTPTGHPLLLPLSEPGMLTRIYVDAELWVAQQLVLRALAGGATTRVISGRPQAWWPMIRRLAEPRRLWLAQTDSSRSASIQVCDHVPPSYPSGAQTLLVVGTDDQQMADEADIVIRQCHGTDQVILTVGQRRMPVLLSATKEETRYLGRLD
ncbi:type VII secretion protein EccE [Mycobacterium kansasii]